MGVARWGGGVVWWEGAWQGGEGRGKERGRLSHLAVEGDEENSPFVLSVVLTNP